jgi:hypothetical protein
LLPAAVFLSDGCHRLVVSKQVFCGGRLHFSGLSSAPSPSAVLGTKVLQRPMLGWLWTHSARPRTCTQEGHLILTGTECRIGKWGVCVCVCVCVREREREREVW